MNTFWNDMPEVGSGKPFSCEQVLLAVPHTIAGEKTHLDPDFPWSFYIASWDGKRSEWETTETDEETGRTFCIRPEHVSKWFEITVPDLSK